MAELRLDLSQWTTMYVSIDYAFSLNFANLESRQESDRVSIRISGPFVFADGEHELTMEAETDPTSVGPALRTCRTRPKALEVNEDGTLILLFEDHISIVVHPLSKYEAWTVNGPAESVLVCTPGGNVAIFGRVQGTPLKLPVTQWPPEMH